MAAFPTTRMRRMRANDWSRRLMRENTLTPDDLVWTIVVSDRADPTEAVPSMPGVERLGVKAAADAARRAKALGIPAIAIFPNIDASLKDENGREADNPDGLVADAIKVSSSMTPRWSVCAPRR